MDFAIIPASWASKVQAVFRIVVGLAFLEHGTGKLLNFPVLSGLDKMPHGLLLFTGAMELLGGALIVVGLFTRPVAFVLSGFMAVAYFMVHFPIGFFPATNYGEAALLYCFAFLFLAAAGPGDWAVDRIARPSGDRLAVSAE
jgi:putative oxidoreductase